MFYSYYLYQKVSELSMVLRCEDTLLFLYFQIKTDKFYPT
ncbi:hypothetical protein HMPREF9141_1672 [Prevotella multiformis DSM 16608]|uniref:Uncharacterized protein n=1 Tax=Prevotella multiformis DSM 16608 TaxID=888743 RepID=F0F7V5_9BACT|nr:hypothetical protein HMPREF9141_1672 [Prevotella multiformis DSM 16608]